MIFGCAQHDSVVTTSISAYLPQASVLGAERISPPAHLDRLRPSQILRFVTLRFLRLVKQPLLSYGSFRTSHPVWRLLQTAPNLRVLWVLLTKKHRASSDDSYWLRPITVNACSPYSSRLLPLPAAHLDLNRSFPCSECATFHPPFMFPPSVRYCPGLTAVPPGFASRDSSLKLSTERRYIRSFMQRYYYSMQYITCRDLPFLQYPDLPLLVSSVLGETKV